MSGASNEHANDDETEVSEEMADTVTVEEAENAEAGDDSVTQLPVDAPESDDSVEDTEGDTPDPELHQKSLRILEAVLFASAEPMTERMLANRLPDGAEVKVLLKELQTKYDGGGVQLNKSGTSWAFRTAPDLSDFLNKKSKLREN